MIPSTIKKTMLSAVLLAAAVLPAQAHVGVGATSSFGAGFGHPLSGLDHVMVMIAAGLWAAQKGGRAIWAWPCAFVGAMLIGGALGMLEAPMPFVEPAILATVVALGLLVALAVDLPVWLGTAVIGLIALFHGHTNGIEAPDNATGIGYVAGFALATALLHLVGVAAVIGLGPQLRGVVRAAGAACAVAGVGLVFGAI